MRVAQILLFMIYILISQIAVAQDQATGAEVTAPADARIFVEMPEVTRGYMKQDMLDHLGALNEIIGLLASGDLATLADVAENRMGRSSMGKYRSTGMGPGRFMPLEMRNIGWGMHDAATELAEMAKKGDKPGAEKALQKVMTSCVICHNSYRTQ